ncbi:MAG: hypothetical protein QOF51_421 [Chloroflexota bacterium]|jgi:lipopolysaccharide heptosyltransferase II|nr:hypothetical protein [Chloroflexota bacterium]
MTARHAARDLLDRLAGLAVGAYGAWSWLHGPRPRLPLDPVSVRRILVIRVDLLGDLVFSLPTLHALRAAFPDARIDALVLPYTAPILQQAGVADTIYTLDVNRYRRLGGIGELGVLLSTLRGIRTTRYDLAVGLSRRVGGLLAAASGARVRVGYAAESYAGAYNVPVAGYRYARSRHDVDYCLDLVRALGIPVVEQVPTLVPPGQHVPPERPYAVLVPGASNGAAKQWALVHWAALADRLAAAHELQIVLAGAASEQPLARRVAAAATVEVVDRTGATTIAELVELLAGARLVVAGDTGPLHVAASLGVPTLGIFGPTNPANNGPLGPNSASIRLGVACSPCYDLRSPADCKLPDRSTICMWGLAPERVYVAAVELLVRSAADCASIAAV